MCLQAVEEARLLATAAVESEALHVHAAEAGASQGKKEKNIGGTRGAAAEGKVVVSKGMHSWATLNEKQAFALPRGGRFYLRRPHFRFSICTLSASWLACP
jgi:hypothetical protein